MERYTLFIDGGKVATANGADVLNPSTGAVVAQMPLATAADLDRAVDAATAAFHRWKLVSDADRAAACRGLAAKIEAHSEELARLLTLEQGKPLERPRIPVRDRRRGRVDPPHRGSRTAGRGVAGRMTAGRVELHRKPIGRRRLDHAVELAGDDRLLAYRSGGSDRQHRRHQAVAADAASTIRLVELINEVLPPGVVNVITGENEIGALMSRHPGIAKVTFTGSIATGRKVMASAAPTLKRLTLELGGNDAGIVLPDADPKAIAEGLFWGAFINNGQTCAAPEAALCSRQHL